jgi:hypothetical protein
MKIKYVEYVVAEANYKENLWEEIRGELGA